uniref:Uncharacterized protein n=1 Tax=Trichogramma kaykai TaxID=54128 RepID=A0ABD2X6Q1_9HYME
MEFGLESGNGCMHGLYVNEMNGEEVILIPHACLTDENILDHKTTDIFNKWDEQFNKRFDWLMESTRKSYLHTVDGYYLKYKCLRSSIGIELLENDFLKIIDKFLKNQKPPSNINFEIYDELFICNWPTIASKIVTYCITSKIREVQDFKREHGIEIFDREKDNIIFALYLLPLCMTVIKKFPSESNTILVPKSKISQSFILFVKENEDLEAKITAHEDYLKSINQEIPAYLIFIGSYTQTSKQIFMPSLKKDVLEILQKDINVSKETFVNLDVLFKRYSCIYDKVDSEKKIMNILKQKGFKEPKDYLIGSKIENSLHDDDFTEIPDNIPLKGIRNYMHQLSLDNDCLSNFVQGKLWKNKYAQSNQGIVLPLYIFYDELEVGNPLGAHAGENKFGAIYSSIATLSPNIASRLDFFFWIDLCER